MPKNKEKTGKVVEESDVIAGKPNEPPESAGQTGMEQDGSLEEVAALAYKMWRERGCPIGSDQEDWFRAEREIRNRKTSPAGAC